MPIQSTYATGPDKAFSGMKADLRPPQTVTCANQSGGRLVFGAVVAFKNPIVSSDDDVDLPRAANAKLKAMVLQGNDFAREFSALDNTVVGELNALGLAVGTIFDGVRAGATYVTCEDGCVPGNPLFVRYALSGGGSPGTIGACRATDAGSSTCIDATNAGTWLSTAAAGQPALLDFDFRAKTGI